MEGQVKYLIVTCMAPELGSKLEKALGISPPQAVWLRNPGGQVTPETLKAILLATVLHQVKEVLIIGHQNCKMEDLNLTDFLSLSSVRGIPRAALPAADLREWLGTFHQVLNTVRNGIEAVKNCPFLPSDLTISGMIYHPEGERLEMLEKDITRQILPPPPVLEEARIDVPSLLTAHSSSSPQFAQIMKEDSLEKLVSKKKTPALEAYQPSMVTEMPPIEKPAARSPFKAEGFPTLPGEEKPVSESGFPEKWELWLETLGSDPETAVSQINRITGKNFSRYTIIGQAILKGLSREKADKIKHLWESWGAKVLLKPQRKPRSGF